MGHNLCLDIFGGPSDAEAAAGLPVHGEASLVRYELEQSGQTLVQRALLPLTNLRVERRIHLADRIVRVEESVENLSGVDRPVGWTEHVTLGPPFLQKGVTEFRASASRSKVFERPFGSADYLVPGRRVRLARRAVARGAERQTSDARARRRPRVLIRLTSWTRCVTPRFSWRFRPEARLAFGYVWRREDFPWMGIWEENASRPSRRGTAPPLPGGWSSAPLPFPRPVVR